jgi:chloramphenicol 3-O-phosphotransferase
MNKLIALAICVWPFPAWSCGVCDEDKVAATYDHSTVARAASMRHDVVFVAVDGPVEPATFVRRVAEVAPRVRGVMRGSVRTSKAPVTFSFVIDPTVQPAARVVDEFHRQLGPLPTLRILKVTSG